MKVVMSGLLIILPIEDIADMWIHEGFTTYSENLYVEYFYGKEAGAEYVISSRKGISNFKPIITGEYGVNRESSGDIYAKGANVLHTLRQLTKDDELWRDTLRGINKDFFHQTVSSNQIENYISKKLNINLKKFFDQYLRDTRIPIFEYEINDGELKYRWSNVINGFNMPIEINLDNKSIKLFPVMDWKHLKTIEGNLEINKNYYVKSNKIFN